MNDPLRKGNLDTVLPQRPQTRQVHRRLQIALPILRVDDPIIDGELQPVSAKVAQMDRWRWIAQNPRR